MQWIYVVDDDAVNRRMAGHFLSKAGMRVTALESGRALLEHMSEDALPELILLDIRMPDMDGFETMERLRIWEKEHGTEETPVVFLTADEESEWENRGFEAGAADYIHKPFDPEILIKRIRNILDKQETISSLKTEATVDNLTGFLNRAAVSVQFPALCETENGCLMMADLDSFKLVNDLHGHETGDKVLERFAEIVRIEGDPENVYGRIGGDEFLFFLRGIHDKEAAESFVRRLNARLSAVAKELMSGKTDVPFGVSAGAVFVPEQGREYEELLRCADKALYLAKKEDRHGISYYEENISVQESVREEPDLQTLSAVLGERNIPDMAFQLDKRAFSYVYQFILRYITRNKRTACKVLFTLSEAGNDEAAFREYCDQFDDHLKQSLRKSDVFTRSRYNQFFIFLTDIHEDAIQTVIDHVMQKWKAQHADKVRIEYETEFVSMGEPSGND